MQNAFVTITTNESKRISIEYVTLGGQLLKKQQQPVVPEMNRVELTLQALSTGVVMIRFRDENGNLLDTKSFIRQ